MKMHQDFNGNPFDFRFSAEFFNQIPENCGVYWFLDSRRNILYVGSSGKLRSDLEIFKLLDMKTVPEQLSELLHKVRQIDWNETENLDSAESMKALLVRQCQPPFNHSKGQRKPKQWFYKVSSKPSRVIISIEDGLDCENSESQYFGPYSNKSELLKTYSAIVRWLWLISNPMTPEDLPAHYTKPMLTQGLVIPMVIETIGNHKIRNSLMRFLNGTSDLFIDLGLRKLESSENLHASMAVIQKLFRSDLVLLESFFRKRARKIQQVRASLTSEQRVN